MLKRFHPAILWTLITTVVACPAIVGAQALGETAGAAAARKPDLDYITPDACMAAIVYPRSVLKSPRLEYLPVEVLSTVMKKESGLDPVEIEQAIFVVEPPKVVPPEGPPPESPELAIVLKMASPIAGEVLPSLSPHTTEGTLDGKTYRKAKGPGDASIYQPDERTLIVGTDSMLRKVVANHASPATGRLKTMLSRSGTPDLLGVVLVKPLRPAMAVLDRAPIPPPLAGLRDAPKLIDYVAFKANFADSQDATLVFRANDDAAAEQLGGIIDGLMTFAQQVADAQLARQEASRDPVEQATAKYSKRMSRRIAEIVRPVRKGAALTTAISPAVLFPPAPAELTAGLAAKKPDLDYITPDAVAGAVLYPQSALKRSSLAQYLPLEILSAAGKEYLGLDPVEIEQAVAVAEMPAGGMPGGAVVLKMASPIAGKEVLPMLAPLTVEDTLDGKTYRKGKGPMNPSIYQADERTLIVGTDAMLRKVVATHAAPAEGKLKTMLSHAGTPDALAVVLVEPLQPMLFGMAKLNSDPTTTMVTNVLKLVDYVAYKVNVWDPIQLMWVIRAKDDTAAKQIEDIAHGVAAVSRQTTAATIGQYARSSDPVEQGLARYFKRLSVAGTEDLPVSRKGSTLTIGLDSSKAGIAVGMLLPAVEAAREAARRAKSLNNMKQIMLAMLNYESTKGTYPPRAICDAQGKPLLSWRVAILPYIEQDALYKQFHLDESWDSPHNRPLIAAMPNIFQNPSSRVDKPGMANYLAVCGKGLMFDGTKGRKMSEITDGTSKTIAVVEADDDRAVEWTKPQDWECDTTKPLAGLGHAHPAGFVAAFADGSVWFIVSNIDPTTFHALLTIAGGEAVQAP